MYDNCRTSGNADLKTQEEGEVKPFSISTGWLMNFKHGMEHHIVKKMVEDTPDDRKAAKFPAESQRISEVGGCTAQRIFNADKTCSCNSCTKT